MNGTEMPQAEHGCGMCDGAIEFVEFATAYFRGRMRHDIPTWRCTSCDWWHTSFDCCHGFQAEHQFHDNEPCFPGCPAWEGQSTEAGRTDVLVAAVVILCLGVVGLIVWLVR